MSCVDPKHFARMEAIVLSMTKEERANPDLLDFSRKKRIARGSGEPVEQVSALVKQFSTMRKKMKHNGVLGRLMAGGQLPESSSSSSLGSWLSAPPPLSRKEQDRKKRLAKLQKKERQKQRRKKR